MHIWLYPTFTLSTQEAQQVEGLPG